MWVHNTHTAAELIYIDWAGAEAGLSDYSIANIPPESGLILLVPGLIMNNGAVIRAECDNANRLIIVGHVNEIRP